MTFTFFKTRIPIKTVFFLPLFVLSINCFGQDDVKGYLEDTSISENVLKKFPAANFYEDLARIYSNGKWGYINKLGDTVLPFIYQNASDFNEGLAAVKLNSKMGFINKKGEAVIPFRYSYADKFWNHFAIVSDEKSKYTFINKEGKLLSSFMFDNVEYFNDFGFANFKIGGKWGVINSSGKIIVPAISKYPVDLRGTKGNVTTDTESYPVDGEGKRIK
ncbi:WG repeat-containing protein [Terrimonas alba]|uniref:WG repeat-containing protein n=1 Tax=Terrimonas alba TaxID=3349636 RepID=UPI0035F4C2BA